MSFHILNRLPTWVWVLLIELYAVVLACLQMGNGVRTDEAKYLLNIPYPHPPLGRFIISSLSGWQYQEIFWRIVLATLLVQLVWLWLKLVADLRPGARFAVAICWLLSSAVLFQSGTIMMVILTALEASAFLYLWMRHDDRSNHSGWIALLWLASLFTAYQIVLFAPLVWILLRRQRSSFIIQLCCFIIPIVLLALYTFSNPLALQSMFNHAAKDAGDTPLMRAVAYLRLWSLGGSIVLSIIGTYGIIRSKSFALIGSFLLVSAYVILSRYDYYAILFTVLFIVGFIILLHKRLIPALPVAIATIVSTFFFALLFPFGPPSIARSVIQTLASSAVHGPVLINGSFGHEWEYESRFPILRYTSALIPNAGAVICLSPCPDSFDKRWSRIMQQPPVYIRK